MRLKLSENGAALIKHFEGFVNPAKRFTQWGEKYATVGWGHYGPDVIAGKTYTTEACNAFFSKDVQRFEDSANKVWQEGMTQNMFDAMVSFAYNHGNIHATSLGKAIQNGMWRDQAKLTNMWRNSYVRNKKGEVLKGLLRRRTKESELFFTQDGTQLNLASAGDYVPSSNSGGSSGGGGSYGGGGGSYGGGYSGGANRGNSGGIHYRQQNANYETVGSMFNGAALNISDFASLVVKEGDAEGVKHTRIYKDMSPTLIISELSMPLDELSYEELKKKKAAANASTAVAANTSTATTTPSAVTPTQNPNDTTLT